MTADDLFNTHVKVLDHGYCELIETWGSDERIIESARMSTGKGFLGWGTADKPGDEKLLRHLWTSVPPHTTPFEMAGITIEVKAPIMVFREWHRHRTQSVNEMSARYVALPNEDYLPSLERATTGGQSLTNKQGSGEPVSEAKAIAWRQELEVLYAHAQAVYELGLELGISRELARLAVTVGRYSRMRASANLLNWARFLSLRNHPKAQQEIQEYAKVVDMFVRVRFPKFWELLQEKKLG